MELEQALKEYNNALREMLFTVKMVVKNMEHTKEKLEKLLTHTHPLNIVSPYYDGKRE